MRKDGCGRCVRGATSQVERVRWGSQSWLPQASAGRPAGSVAHRPGLGRLRMRTVLRGLLRMRKDNLRTRLRMRSRGAGGCACAGTTSAECGTTRTRCAW
ncbi:hypothetical protein Kpho02_60430 [Kitasatospora phosalacinea]|uniref:Uncharacterized protein n=1 Tax=Kitasatospora phosalacinea TaxID=2065 RepID=A0A9W6V635_9ACTN|nr:hypothetical protein Kpho02_60430 [Kitasatospora phosalacinea]